jgi:hypothetical protein
VGLCFLLGGLIKGKKNIYLIRNGILTDARVTGKERTNTKINNRYVYRISYEFHVNGNPYTGTTRTHRIERVLDEAKEKIVYDANDPSRSQMIDVLPKRVRRFFEGEV